MSLLEVLQLVGYSMGATLTLWMSVLLARQRRALERAERVLLALAVAIGLWHACNLFLTLRALLGLDVQYWSSVLRVTDTVAVTSITLAYSLLLHVHLHLWARAQNREFTRFERARVYMSYIPALFLGIAVARIWSGAYAPMLEKLNFFVLPFGVWATYVLALIAGTDFLLARSSPSRNERRLMQTLGASFVGIALLLLSAYALGVGRGTIAGHYLQTLANLGSLLPTALIAYHIYRYRYLELIIKESLVVASFAAVVLVVYLYGIRTLALALTARYSLRASAVESLLVLAFALVVAPLRAWLDKRFHKLFEREASIYRDVLARIGAHAGGYKHLPELLRFIEERTTRELGLRSVRFYARQHALSPHDADEDASDAAATPRGVEWEESVLELAATRAGGVLEDEKLLREHGFEIAYLLQRENKLLGLMLVDAAPDALTADVRAVLEVLAGQVALTLEDYRLIEENVRLERQLAQGERLAALGQMAATVAHEVKNPLSAIKSIAQVMREDERLSAEYTRDLDLIVGETDRLNRSVTQLLNFARHAPPTGGAPARAGDLARSIVELFRAEAKNRNVQLDARCQTEHLLDGAQASAVRDALSNLLLNALQETPFGGRVSVEAVARDGELQFAVTDGGAGVPQELRRRIWEPFFTTKQRGTGLGLAIVRKRIEDAGGHARLAPNAAGAGGARFELSLPITNAAQEEAEASEASEATAARV
ncbi:MAG TPA: ATP-binding protein [Pyrinomonadaceae bacterium]|nr:ATP-binding protein [Pyrinomonadaceae bacterium]